MLDFGDLNPVNRKQGYWQLDDYAFRQWAFGTTDGSTLFKNTPALWNALHSDIFVTEGCYEVKYDLNRMYEAYLNNKACK